jgi:hypothetical protein
MMTNLEKRNAVEAIKKFEYIILINLGKNNRCYKYKYIQ